MHIDKETGAYTSPRQQGAGIVDTAAVSTGHMLHKKPIPKRILRAISRIFTFNSNSSYLTDTDEPEMLSIPIQIRLGWSI